jgi:alkanesulfonate monooxygenase SsuD/methylene tetrahydromethanopterin reductase-like flavin-dependent oxidoreductase (luciferase family)
VKGPLNLARPLQGWPVIVQAGSSELGRALAAETADVVFSAHPTLAEGQRFYADVKGRMAGVSEAARGEHAVSSPARRRSTIWVRGACRGWPRCYGQR